MERIPIAIVGCGGMGGRHLRGMKELYDSGMANVELVAACDLKRENAEHLADTAETLLGDRPRVFTDLEAMARAIPDLRAVDITTDSGTTWWRAPRWTWVCVLCSRWPRPSAGATSSWSGTGGVTACSAWPSSSGATPCAG